MDKVVLAWRDAHARLGQHLELGERLCFGFHFYIADAASRAREAGEYYEENLKMFGPLRLVRALTEQQIEDMADPRRRPRRAADDRGRHRQGWRCAAPLSRSSSTSRSWRSAIPGSTGSR